MDICLHVPCCGRLVALEAAQQSCWRCSRIPATRTPSECFRVKGVGLCVTRSLLRQVIVLSGKQLQAHMHTMIVRLVSMQLHIMPKEKECE